MKRLAAVGFDLIFDNPVINKELRSRMRGTRSYWLLLGYLLILSVAMFLAYVAWSLSNHSGYVTASFTVGRTLFTTVFIVQACLIALIMPALTSGSITIEHEQRTFEMVRCTTLRPGSIVLGKLVSSVSFVALLITCALPLVSICFLLGGVAPDEVVGAYAMLLCDAFLFGAAGIACSSCVGNTAGATSLSYGTLAVYFGLTLVPAVFHMVPFSTSSFGLSALNPVGAVNCASTTEHYFGWTVPAWVAGLIINGLLACLLCFVAINRLDDFPSCRATKLRISTFAFVAALVFFCDGTVADAVTWGMPETASTIGWIGLIALVLFGPIFATGNPADDHNAFARRSLAVSPVAAFRDATVRSGVVTTILFAVMLIVEALFALHSVPHPLMAAKRSMPVARWVIPEFAGLYLSIAFSIGGVGLLISMIARNRWASVMFTYVLFLFAWLAPVIGYTTISSYDLHRMPIGGALNWLYLSPFGSLAAIFDPGAAIYYDHLSFSTICPSWAVTVAIYAAVGLVALIIALWLAARERQTARTA